MRFSIFLAVAMAIAAAGWILSGQLEDEAAGGSDPSSVAETAAGDKSEKLQSVRAMDSAARAFPRRLTVSGRTEPSRQVVIRGETEGKVIDIAAERGQIVEAGQTLVRLEEDTRPAELEEARAFVAQRTLEFDVATKLKTSGHRAVTNVAEARANLDEAMARLRAVEIDIANTEIASPFDGVLDSRPVELGDYVQMGDEVATIVDLDPILITAAVSELQRQALAVGAPGAARLITGETVEGVIRFISSVADPNTRTFDVELEVPNPDDRHLAGVTAELILDLRSVMAHRISSGILVLDDNGRLGVRTLDKEDRVRFRPVDIVATESGGIWVGGLAKEVRIIVVGQDYVGEGQKVAPQIVPDPNAQEPQALAAKSQGEAG